MAAARQVLNPNILNRDAERLERRLRKAIVGQEEAIENVIAVYQTYLAGMSAPGRPVGSFLFLGPTGSGKTRLVEATAEALTGDARAVIKIDCGEYQHGHEIAKLVGSPPGYLGHRETHAMLSQENLNAYQTEECKLSFVLFDEIEKASPTLWNLMLGILDKATLTLGDNRRVDFSRAMVFMTGNVGASEMSSLLSPRLGFVNREPEQDGELWQKVQRTGIDALRKKFTPEFINRIDKIAVFRPLGPAELRRVLDLELGIVQQRILQSDQAVQFVFRCTGRTKEFLLREGTDMHYGARHLKRAIERHLVGPLANLMATEQVHSGDLIRVDLSGASLVFEREAENMGPVAVERAVSRNATTT